MATLKQHQRLTQLVTLAVVAGILLLNSACGTRGGYYNSDYRQQSGTDQSKLFVPVAGLPIVGAQQIQQIAQNNPNPTMSATQLTQISEDFGDLNTCYQNILNQGVRLFAEGRQTTQYIFAGSGQELVKCYQYIVAVKNQQYQQDLQRQQWWNNLLPLLYQQGNSGGTFSGSYPDMTIPRPPSVGGTR
jgi:hypothetical protein